MAVSWIPPDVRNLSFTSGDCILVSKWTVSVVQERNRDIPFDATIQVLTRGLEHYYSNSTSQKPSPLDLLQWASNHSTRPKIFNTISFFTWDQCRRDFCPQLGWEGNPDLAGRGVGTRLLPVHTVTDMVFKMVVCYFLQAVLTTFYAAVIAFMRVRRFSETSVQKYPIKNKTIRRALTSIKHSTRVFLDASMLFCFAMLGAAIVTFARGHSGTKPVNTYVAQTTSFMSLYTILPALSLQTVASNSLRRTKFRAGLWITIALMMFTVIGLFYTTPFLKNTLRDIDLDQYFDPEKDDYMQFEFERWCFTDSSSNYFAWVVKGFIIGLSASITIHMTLRTLPRKIRPRRLKPIYSYGWLAMAIIYLMGSWASLGLFVSIRNQLEGISGPGNKDHEWAFGQVLSIATFVPVLGEAAYIWTKGPTRALTGLMMGPYEAVIPEEEEAEETQEKGYQGMDSSEQETPGPEDEVEPVGAQLQENVV